MEVLFFKLFNSDIKYKVCIKVCFDNPNICKMRHGNEFIISQRINNAISQRINNAVLLDLLWIKTLGLCTV